MHFFPALPIALADVPQAKVDAATRHCHSSGNSKSSPLPKFTTFGSLTDPSSSFLTATCLRLESQLLPLCSFNPTKCIFNTLKKPRVLPRLPIWLFITSTLPTYIWKPTWTPSLILPELYCCSAFHKHQDEALPASHSSLTPYSCQHHLH